MKGEKEAYLSVAEMADLLFNDTSPDLCYASHRLLNEDRTFFKQVGRLPPNLRHALTQRLQLSGAAKKQS